MIHVFQFLQTVFWQNSHFVLVNRVEWLWHQSDSFVKPGSHLPPSYLRHDSDIAASSFCNTVPMWEQKSPATAQQYLGLYRRHACKVEWVGLCRHAGGKDLRCFLSRRRYVLIRRGSIAGSSGGMWEPGFIIICFCGLDGAQRSQSPLMW